MLEMDDKIHKWSQWLEWITIADPVEKEKKRFEIENSRMWNELAKVGQLKDSSGRLLLNARRVEELNEYVKVVQRFTEARTANDERLADNCRALMAEYRWCVDAAYEKAKRKGDEADVEFQEMVVLLETLAVLDQKDWVMSLPDLEKLTEKLELETELGKLSLLLNDFDACPKSGFHKEHIWDMYQDLLRHHAWVRVLHYSFLRGVLPETHHRRLEAERFYIQSLQDCAIYNKAPPLRNNDPKPNL